MNLPSYTPIACGLHDELQLRAMRRAETTVRYRPAPDGPAVEIRGRITDVRTRGKEEFLTVSPGPDEADLEIRLDFILEVDGIPFRGSGC